MLQLPQKKYFNLFVDRQSHLWLSTSDEILRYDGRDWQTVDAPSIGLVRAFTTVPDGRVWIVGWTAIAVYDPKMDK